MSTIPSGKLISSSSKPHTNSVVLLVLHPPFLHFFWIVLVGRQFCSPFFRDKTRVRILVLASHSDQALLAYRQVGSAINMFKYVFKIPLIGCPTVLGVLSGGSRLLAGSVVSAVLLLLLSISLMMLLLGVLVVSLLVLWLSMLAVVPTGLGLSVAGLVTPTRLQMILRLVQFTVLPAAMRLRRWACRGSGFLFQSSSGRSQVHYITRLGLHYQPSTITGYFFSLSGPGNLCQHQ